MESMIEFKDDGETYFKVFMQTYNELSNSLKPDEIIEISIPIFTKIFIADTVSYYQKENIFEFKNSRTNETVICNIHNTIFILKPITTKILKKAEIGFKQFKE